MLSRTDQQEAIESGSYGVRRALEGETGKMISFKRSSQDPYIVSYATEDVTLICNEEKTVPLEWITDDGSNISDDFITYARPLIPGDVTVPMEDGLPEFAYRK